MFTLKRSWGEQTLKSTSLLHLSRNINFSINQSNNGLFLINNNKTDSTMTINGLEAAVYFVLDKHINNNQYFLSDIELASYVCMHLNIFDTRQWGEK